MTSTLPHELFIAAGEAFGRTLEQVQPDDWGRPTPCEDWDVRALTNHLVSETAWAPALVEGATIADVGDRFDGDLLGDDPIAAWFYRWGAAAKAFESLVHLQQPVHLSWGDEPAAVYLNQLSADFVVHRWDLAIGSGQEATLDPAMVDIVAAWFEGQFQMYLDAGVIDPPLDVPADADAQTKLLAKFGRAIS